MLEMGMYKDIAEQMKQQVASGKVHDDAKDAIMKSAEIYDFLGEAEERGLLQDVADKLLGEGLLNDAIKGYVAMTLDDSDLTQPMRDAVEGHLKYYLDTKTSSEAREYYRRK